MSIEFVHPPTSRNDLGRAVLDFIVRTSMFEAEFKRRRDSGEITPKDLRRIEMELPESPASIVARSREIINACLADIGGIPHFIDDTTTGQRLPCTYIKWQGNHPEQAGHHLWQADFIGQLGRHEITLPAGAIEEFCELFQN